MYFEAILLIHLHSIMIVKMTCFQRDTVSERKAERFLEEVAAKGYRSDKGKSRKHTFLLSFPAAITQ